MIDTRHVRARLFVDGYPADPRHVGLAAGAQFRGMIDHLFALANRPAANTKRCARPLTAFGALSML